jgi:superfamily II DNA or RNA helicase
LIPTLHPFQLDLYHRVRAAGGRGARVIVVQGATGCGKNTWAAHVARQAALKGVNVLLLVHRRKLVNQISERLFQFEVLHTVLMRGEPFKRGNKVMVASRDTLLSRCYRNQWLGLPPAGLIIVDEAHHAAQPDSECRRILENYPHATVLLLSATPVGPDGHGLGSWAQAIECAAPTSQLVCDGYLVPVKCYAPERRRKGRRALRGITGDLVESWRRYGEGRPTVLFTSRVQHSLEAVAAFQAAGIPAAHLDAGTADDDRDRVLEEVAAGRVLVLCNVGIVGEGVDVPELSCCQLYCEVNSRVRFLQAVGRIMRPSPGKTHGVLIDHAGAVFRHGFPDEDTEWTLTGNADKDFAAKHAAGKTEQAFYCKRCELAYHRSSQCPQCGRVPAKPPKSVFAPPPVRPRHELLTEADRDGWREDADREERVRHWLRCLAVAKNRDGSFGMAAQVYRKKYRAWPPDDFPCIPKNRRWKDRIKDVYPDFGKKPAASGPD